MANQSPRTLYVLPDFGMRGDQTILLAMLAAQQAAGRADSVVCGLASGPLLDQFVASGVSCHVLGGHRPAGYLTALRRLIALVRRERIDAICSFNTPLDRCFAQLAGLIARVPVVVWLMTMATPLPPFPPPRGRELAFLKRLAAWVVNALSARRVAAFMSLSNAVTDSYARLLRLPPSRFVLVPPGLPAGVFTAPRTYEELRQLREDLGVAAAYPLLLNVGVLCELKGQQHLVPCLEIVLKSLPGAQLLLVGEGPAREALVAAVAQAGLAERIHLLGHRHDVAALLAVSDALISASKSEGFGMTVLEAMAAGKPVVAAFTRAFAEFAVAQETALFVERPDGDLLADAVVALFSELGRAEQMGRAGRRAAEAFRADLVGEKVAAVIARVVAAAG